MAIKDFRHSIPDTEALKRAGDAECTYSSFRLTGYVTRMPDERLPKIPYGELQEGKRSHGGQKKRYKDTL